MQTFVAYLRRPSGFWLRRMKDKRVEVQAASRSEAYDLIANALQYGWTISCFWPK